MPNEAIDYQAIQAIANAVQIGNQAIAQRQQNEMQKKQLEQAAKEYGQTLKLQQDKLQLEQELFELDKKKQSALEEHRKVQEANKLSLGLERAQLQREKFNRTAQEDALGKARALTGVAAETRKQMAVEEENLLMTKVPRPYINPRYQLVPYDKLNADLQQSMASLYDKSLNRTEEAEEALKLHITELTDALEIKSELKLEFQKQLTPELQQMRRQLQSVSPGAAGSPPDIEVRTNAANPNPAPTADLQLPAPSAPGAISPQAFAQNPTEVSKTIMLRAGTPGTDQVELAGQVFKILSDPTVPAAQRKSLEGALKSGHPDLFQAAYNLGRQKKAAPKP